MIETLVAERAEDRRKLETLARDVEHFQSEIFMMKKLKKQDEQEIRNLSERLDVVLEDREKDREMIENLEMTMCKKHNDCDLNNHDGIRKMNDVYKNKSRDENYVMAQSKVYGSVFEETGSVASRTVDDNDNVRYVQLFFFTTRKCHLNWKNRTNKNT